MKTDRKIYFRNIDNIKKEVSEYVPGLVRPPVLMDVDKWAEENLYLSSRVSARPGKLDLSITPYLRKPLQSLKTNRKIVCIFGSQVGKTIFIQTCLGYFIDQAPGPTMIIYPNQASCKRRSKKHIQTFINDAPCLKKHVTGKRDDMQLFEYRLDRMDVSFAWGGSDTMLASEPIKYIMFDEFSKMTKDAIAKGNARVRSYGWMAREIYISTPETKDNDPGHDELINGTHEKLHIACLKCGEYQEIEFSDIIYPEQKEGERFSDYMNRIYNDTFAQCSFCKHKMYDSDIFKVLSNFKWVAGNPNASYPSFHMPAWYSPWYGFRNAAKDFVEKKQDVITLREWVNETAADFWEEKGEGVQDKNIILQHKSDYAPCTVPTNDPVITILTVDVQKDYLWYLVRAHTQRMSWMIDNGTLSVLDDIEEIKAKRYKKANEKPFSVDGTFIDSRYRTTEVYDYCLDHEYCIPLMGQDTTQGTPIRWQKLNKYPGTNKNLPGQLSLMHLHVPTFAEILLKKFRTGIDINGNYDSEIDDWFLHNETGEGYAKHLMSKTVMEEVNKKTGEIKRIWKETSKRHDFFDLEVYQLAARYLSKEGLAELVNPTVIPNHSQEIPEAYR